MRFEMPPDTASMWMRLHPTLPFERKISRGRLLRSFVMSAWRTLLTEYADTPPFDAVLDDILSKSLVSRDPSERQLAAAAKHNTGPVSWKIEALFPPENVILPRAWRARTVETDFYRVLSCGHRDLVRDLRDLTSDTELHDKVSVASDMLLLHIGSLKDTQIPEGMLAALQMPHNRPLTIDASITWIEKSSRLLGVPCKLDAYMRGVPVEDLIGDRC